MSTGKTQKVILHLPVASLVEELAALEREYEANRRILTQLSLDSISVTYESISGPSGEAELRQLLSFLGVDLDVRLEPRWSTKITPR